MGFASRLQLRSSENPCYARRSVDQPNVSSVDRGVPARPVKLPNTVKPPLRRQRSGRNTTVEYKNLDVRPASLCALTSHRIVQEQHAVALALIGRLHCQCGGLLQFSEPQPLGSGDDWLDVHKSSTNLKHESLNRDSIIGSHPRLFA